MNDILVLYEKRTGGGVECSFFDNGDRTGWKVFAEEDDARRAFKTQEYLAKLGLAPDCAGTVCVIAEDSREMQWAYLTELVDVASDVSNDCEGKLNGVYDAVQEVGALLVEKIQELFEVQKDDCDWFPTFDLHTSNWGFGKDHRPKVLDTGYYFYKHIPEEKQKEILGEIVT